MRARRFWAIFALPDLIPQIWLSRRKPNFLSPLCPLSPFPLPSLSPSAQHAPSPPTHNKKRKPTDSKRATTTFRFQCRQTARARRFNTVFFFFPFPEMPDSFPFACVSTLISLSFSLLEQTYAHSKQGKVKGERLQEKKTTRKEKRNIATIARAAESCGILEAYLRRPSLFSFFSLPLSPSLLS